MMLRGFFILILLLFLAFLSGCTNQEALTGTLQASEDSSSQKNTDSATSETPGKTIPPVSLSEIRTTQTFSPQETLPVSVPHSAQTGESQSKISTDDMVQKAKEDLARRLEISPDQVSLLTIIGQEFTGVAFSCQAQKERITRDVLPATVEGYSILLVTEAGHRYEYHGNDREVFFCRSLTNTHP